MIKSNFIKFLLYILVVISVVFSSCGAKKKVSHSRGNSNEFNTNSIYSSKSKHSYNVVQYYADVLSVSVDNLDKSLYTFIDDWIKVPHRLGGVDKKGVDCSGFVNLLYHNVYGKSLPRTSYEMGDLVKRKYENELKEGDLVFFSFGGKNIDHVGVYLHNGKFVHVSTKGGVIISNLKDSWYYKYFTRCGTPKI